MQIRNTTITCFAALATTAVVAIEHGELGEFHGVKYRWHQLAQGHYTGVVPEDWDEKGKSPIWIVDWIMQLASSLTRYRSSQA